MSKVVLIIEKVVLIIEKVVLIIEKPVNHGITYRINNNSLLTCNIYSDFYMNLLKRCITPAKLHRTVLKSMTLPLVYYVQSFYIIREDIIC
jgi:hypothetical protein